MQRCDTTTSSIAIVKCSPLSRKYLESRVRETVTRGTRTKPAADAVRCSAGTMPEGRLLEKRLPVGWLTGAVSFAESCPSRSIWPDGIVATCAEQAQPPIAIARPSIVPCAVFMLPSSRFTYAAAGVFDCTQRWVRPVEDRTGTEVPPGCQFHDGLYTVSWKILHAFARRQAIAQVEVRRRHRPPRHASPTCNRNMNVAYNGALP